MNAGQRAASAREIKSSQWRAEIRTFFDGMVAKRYTVATESRQKSSLEGLGPLLAWTLHDCLVGEPILFKFGARVQARCLHEGLRWQVTQ